jgi:hypothetical protein
MAGLDLEVGVWSFSGAWSLVLGAWNLVFGAFFPSAFSHLILQAIAAND